MSSTIPWWVEEAYGSFAEGEEGYPDAGQVCRAYREKIGFKPSTLAHALGITDVAVRGMENKRTGLDSITLRRRLVSLLAIPPVLLGLNAPPTVPFWWLREGLPAFLTGPDGYPCPGQVVKYYREQKKQSNASWTQAGLGIALNISDVAVRGMENNNESLDSLSRRRALVFILGIPPALLGLDSLHYTPTIPVERVTRKGSTSWPLEKVSIKRFLESLPLYWYGYYNTSELLNPLHELSDLLRDLRATIMEMRGSQRQQGLELLVNYYQLASTIFRDQCHYRSAFFYANRAVKLARNLDKKELLVSSLLRRSFISFEQDNMPAALMDLNIACPLAASARPSLKGLVFQVAGHVHAHLAQNATEQKVALTLLDDAAHIAYAGPYVDDDTSIKFSIDWHHVERAEAYLALHKPDQALRELDTASDSLAHSGQARRLAHLNIYRAKAYLCKNELADATTYALSALKVSSAVQSNIKVSLILNLYQELSHSPYGQNPDVARLGLLLRSY